VCLVLLVLVDAEGAERDVQQRVMLVEWIEVHDADDDVRPILVHLGVSEDIGVLGRQEQHVVVGLQGR
jgi:hypothetical protein